jgi:hypothetical protein
MPLEIRVYFEGDRRLKQGFVDFLRQLQSLARSKRMYILPVACGSKMLKDFSHALEDHTEGVNLLLVDAEELVVGSDPWNHLANRQDNRLVKPRNAGSEQAHLMVQVMESWFLADREALAAYYRQGFRAGSLPSAPIESIPKADVLRKLKAATRNTQKGKYHKTGHAPELLAKLSAEKVRAASPWCNRLFETIENAIEAAG